MTTTAVRPHPRWPVELLATAGVLALGAVIALAVSSRDGAALTPAVLPLAFLVAGVLGTWARPDHGGVRLLLAVGTTHLLAFAVTGWVGATGQPAGWWLWSAALAGDAAYLAGFVLLALLIAGYPGGGPPTTGLRRFALLGSGFATAALVVEATLRAQLGLALDTGAGAAAVPAPAPLPLAENGPSLTGLVPGLVVVGVGMLLVRARGLAGADRRAVGWAGLAGGVLALLLVATPVAPLVLPPAVWDVVFVTVVSAVPFALLAGLVRYRLLEVDVYVVRTLGRGVVVLLVLLAYAAAAVTTSGPGTVAVAVAVTVLAALTGTPVLRRVQDLTDRWLTGGRVGSRAVVDELVTAIEVPDRDRLGQRICGSVARALDVAWVRLVVDSAPVAEAGLVPGSLPEVVLPLRAAGIEVGRLELGPRRGGWGRTQRAEVEAIGTPAALALREAELTAQLRARVAELTESRDLLVQAEQTVRRRIERDLHDGAQQQLVALLARLGVARALAGEGSAGAAPLAAAQDLAQQCLRDLRDLVTGLHPAVLGARGLVAAVEARAGLMPIPVAVDADPRVAAARFLPEVESAAFFVLSEALANVLKHSGSARARVVLAPLPSGGLRVAVSDEGSGTTASRGTGLAGLRTRVEALGGHFAVQSTPGVGTTVVAEFSAAQPVAAGV